MPRKKLANATERGAFLEQVLDQVDRVIDGRVSREEAAAWAGVQMATRTLSDRDLIVSAALRRLASSPHLKAGDAQSDLQEIGAVLRGEAPFVLEARLITETELRRRLPQSSIDQSVLRAG